MSDPLAPIRPLLNALARDCLADGAQAVLLVGSWARGDAHPHSDVDLLALGEGPDYRLLVRAKRLISLSWQTVDAVKQSFREPGEVGTAIPGWRTARILVDPSGIAARLVEQAHQWNWNLLETDPDRWAANRLAGLAEEVLKLIEMTTAEAPTAAAVQRNVLVLQLAGLMAVRRRLLYETENRLWDCVAEDVGPEWARHQSHALDLNGIGWKASCRAALELYRLAAAETVPFLDTDSQEVVQYVLRCAVEQDLLRPTDQ